jgi:1,4-alpha-glucan branching enzyme
MRAPMSFPFSENQIANRNKKQMKLKTRILKYDNLTPVNRMTPFAFQAPAAIRVSLAGDFNDWDTQAGPMRKGPDGVWHLSVALKPGRYEYRFVADEAWCDDPAAKQRTANSMGTENCVRVV